MAEVSQLKRRLSALQGAREIHEIGWMEIFDASYPERSHGLLSSPSLATEIQSKKNRILDDTLADAMRILGSAIVSGTTPANSLWFGLSMGGTAEDETPGMTDEERWLEQAANTIFTNIHGSNFDPSAYEGSIDLVAAGWFVMYIDEAREGGYHFELWPLSECYIASSRPGEAVDTIYRKAIFTVEQVVNKYGLDKCSERVKSAYAAATYDTPVEICHAIYPRALSVAGARMAKNLPIASCHFESADGNILLESGYHEFPCVVPRWMLTPGTSYATGPASKAMGSVRTLLDVKTMELANLDIATGGMWIGVDDGILNPRTVKIGPRKIITAASTDSMKELRSGADFNVAFSSEERLQAQIRKTLLADQLQPQDGPAMTATEVHARIQLIRQLLGPIYARLQSEYLQPLVNRCFGIAYRAGVLGVAPESLQGRNFVVKYVSPLARAQRMEEVTAIDQYVAGAVQAAQVEPQVLDTVDFDAAQKIRAEALGVPAGVIPTDAQIAKKRADRQAAQQAAQQQAMQQEALMKAAPAIAGKMVA